MAKITLTDLASGINTTTSINSINQNNADIEAAIENTLSRDGTSPNTMSADLDMNSNNITNLPTPTSNTHAANKAYVDTIAASGVAGADGTDGTDGEDGWSAVLAVVENGTDRVLQIVSYTGGAGLTPGYENYYIGAAGPVSDIGSAVNIRGATGSAGAGTGDLLAANNLSDLDTIATARTNLGLAIGTDVQAYDAQLVDIAALAVTDGNIIVGDGTNWVAESGATARASLGLTIGTHVQAYDADLTAIAALANTDGNIIVGNGSAWIVESGATARTSLGAAGLSQTEMWSWFIETPTDKDYDVIVDIPYACSVTKITTDCESGTCTLTGKINTTSLGGTANSVSTTENGQAHSTSNSLSAGDNFRLTVSSNSSCIGMTVTVKVTRTLV